MQVSITYKKSLFWNWVIKWKEEVKLIASSCAPQDIPNILKGIVWIHLCQAGEISACSIASKWLFKMVLLQKEGVFMHTSLCPDIGIKVFK